MTPTTTRVVPPPSGGVTFGTPKAAPSVIYYGTCGVRSATIKMTVSSPLGISSVNMRYGALNPATNVVQHWYPQRLDLTSGVWTGTIATTGVLAPDLSGNLLHIRMYFVATDGQGVQSESSLYPDVLEVKYCGAG